METAPLGAACASQVRSWVSGQEGYFEDPPFERSIFLARAYTARSFRESGPLHSTAKNGTAKFAYFTLLTGGVLYSADVSGAYRSLTDLAYDIDRQIALPIGANARSEEGTRVIFELDLDERLPTAAEFKQLLSTLYTVVEECFQLPTKPLALLSACAPRQKKNDALGVGFHLVFPDVVVEVVTLFHVVKYAQDRLARENSPFAAALDLAPVKVHAGSVSLRPNGVPKRRACAVCALRKKHPYVRVACSTFCFRGSEFPLSSVYSLLFSFGRSTSGELQADFRCLRWSTLRSLQQTSVFPAPEQVRRFAQCSLGLEPGTSPQTRGVKRDRVYLRQTSASSTASTRVAHELCALIRRLFPEFATLSSILHCLYDQDNHLVLAKRLVSKQYEDISRRCLIAQRTHKSNENYFTLNLRTRRLVFHCYDVDCRASDRSKARLAREVEERQVEYIVQKLRENTTASVGVPV